MLKSPGTQGQGVASVADDHLQRKLPHKPTNWQRGRGGSSPHTKRKDRRSLGNIAINGRHNRKCSPQSRTRRLCWEVGKAHGKYSGRASQLSFLFSSPTLPFHKSIKGHSRFRTRMPFGCHAASCKYSHLL